MMPYQWTSAGIALVIAVAIARLVRHNHLHARSATFWILLAAVIAIIGAFPGIVDWFAAKLGISYSPILAVLLTLGVVLLKSLRTGIGRSKERQQLRILAGNRWMRASAGWFGRLTILTFRC